MIRVVPFTLDGVIRSWKPDPVAEERGAQTAKIRDAGRAST